MGLSLDSTSWVSYDNPTAFNGAEKLSASYWIYPAASAVTSADTYIHRINTTTKHGFNIGTAYSYPRIPGGSFKNANSYDSAWSFGTNKLTASAWNHVLVVYDGTIANEDARVAVYINGTSYTVAGQNYVASIGALTDQDLFFQNNSGTVVLAEVAFWIGTAITSSEVIAALSTASESDPAVAPPEAGAGTPSFYFPFTHEQAGLDELVANLTQNATSGSPTTVTSHPYVSAWTQGGVKLVAPTGGILDLDGLSHRPF